MSNILIVLTGSIACYKACDAISQLVQRGHQVRAVATEAALRFVGTATLEGLTRSHVGTDLFAAGEALDHITLSRWADVTLVCPATANTLNRLAAGLADDLAGALLLAHEWKKPLLVAPAMNPAMWTHPATREAVQKLRSWGVRFIEPAAGRTACGEVGEGRLSEPDEIVAAVEGALQPAVQSLRILVTAGGTSEPIDGVRVLTNSSSGATGAAIAEQLAAHGHEVRLLRARSSVSAGRAVKQEVFTSFADLQAVLQRRLAEDSYDVVVHAAAVSDYSVDAVEVDGDTWQPGAGKIPSAAAPTIRLRRNPKLVESIRSWSRNPAVCIVAFKLTRGANAEQVRRAVAALFAKGGIDFVVHNDLVQRTDAAFPADIWRADQTVAARCPDRHDIASALERVVLARFERSAATT